VSDTDDLLAGLAEGLRRRVFERARTEARLADFVFREGSEDPGRPLVEPSGWRHFVSRTLAAAGEPGTLDVLERVSLGDETLGSLANDRATGLDRGLATADRIAGLAAAGLVRRDLETGRVGLTDLGAAVLAFARAWEQRAATAAVPERSEPR
jgi:hypothetical protein